MAQQGPGDAAQVACAAYNGDARLAEVWGSLAPQLEIVIPREETLGTCFDHITEIMQFNQ